MQPPTCRIFLTSGYFNYTVGLLHPCLSAPSYLVARLPRLKALCRLRQRNPIGGFSSFVNLIRK